MRRRSEAGIAQSSWPNRDRGATSNLDRGKLDHGEPLDTGMLVWNAPLEQSSIDEYSELIAQKIRFMTLQPNLKMLVENLAVFQARLSQEHSTMVRIEAENDALASTIQTCLPGVSFNVSSSQVFRDRLADFIQGDMATTLHDIHSVLSSTCHRTGVPLQSTRDNMGSADEHWSFTPSKGSSHQGFKHSSRGDQREESVQAGAHQYSSGAGGELHRRVTRSSHDPSPGSPCRSCYNPPSYSHPSYPNHPCACSGHSAAPGSLSNIYGPSPGLHRSGASMHAQWHDQPTLWWSQADGSQGNNRQCICNLGRRVVPNYEQQPDNVLGSAQLQGRRARQLRAMAPGTVTIMVRNIPARYNKERLLLEWPVERHNFNMLYLPSNKRGMSMGFAFLSFPTPDNALAFQRRWHGHYLTDHGSNKHLDVAQARVQGLVESLRDILKGVDRPTWRIETCAPLVFEGNRLLDLHKVLRQHGLVPDDLLLNAPQQANA